MCTKWYVRMCVYFMCCASHFQMKRFHQWFDDNSCLPKCMFLWCLIPRLGWLGNETEGKVELLSYNQTLSFVNCARTNFSYDTQSLLVVWSSSTHKNGHIVFQQLVLVLCQCTDNSLQRSQVTLYCVYHQNVCVCECVRIHACMNCWVIVALVSLCGKSLALFPGHCWFCSLLTLNVAATLVKLAMPPPMIRTLPAETHIRCNMKDITWRH